MSENTEPPQDSFSWKKLGSRLQELTDPTCELCPIHQETERVCLPVNPPGRKLKVSGSAVRAMIVGEAPGYNEEQTGKLFSGRAGKLLNEVLEEVGLKREWFFVTNAVKCRPEDNRTPTPKEIRTCSSVYLSKELAEVRPHYGLALGNGGCQAVLGKKGITKLNGTMVERHGVKWVFAFHPAAVLRNPRYRNSFQQALLIFSRLLRNEEGIPETKTTFVNNKDSLKALLAEFDGAKTVTIDTETWSEHPSVGRFKGGGLAWWDPSFKLVSLQLTFKAGYSYSVPLWHDKTPWKHPQKVLDILKPYLEDVPYWIMQNGKFDSKVMEVVGVHIRHSWDNMGATYALDENNLKGLGFLSMSLLGVPDYKDMVDKSNMFYEPLDLVLEYGGKDTDYTHRLFPITKRRLKTDPLSYRLFKRLLHPADLVLTNVEYRGVPLDEDKLEARSFECDQNIEEQEKGVWDRADGWQFNIRSTAQLADVLYNRLELPVLEMTNTGKPSTREGVLLRLKPLDQTGIIDSILAYRQWSGYRSRYLTPWPILADSEWRLHSHFKPYHTVTGRLSSENPNLQQVPRNTFIRGIIGGRPGWKIVEADYSQAEMRLAAHYSQDRTLLRIFNTGRDAHMEMAMAMTGKVEDEVTTEERKKAKAVNFGFLYGMGYNKFMTYAAENYGVAVAEHEAKKARKDYFTTYRSLQGWHARQKKKAKNNGYVMSAIGRKRHLHDINSTNEGIRGEAERQAINSPVQSLASDMMLLAMIQLEKMLPNDEARLVSTVHDSIIFEIREDKVDKWVPVIRQTMEEVPLERLFDVVLTVPIVADVKVGDHWSEDSVEV